MKEKMIKNFASKHGEITVTAYTENGHTEYKVKHTHPAIETFWTQELFHALKHAQYFIESEF